MTELSTVGIVGLLIGFVQTSDKTMVYLNSLALVWLPIQTLEFDLAVKIDESIMYENRYKHLLYLRTKS